MIPAFTRITLALAMAVVFVGQMEAAAAHCARLAQAEAVAETPAAETPDCHGMTSESMAAETTPAHHQAPHHSPDDQTPADHCDCIGALKVCAAPAALPGSTSIAPYAWQTPEAIHFASVEPAPALRPPRI